ncbi:hypothetical protein GCM10011571_35450 [Marinithermofilum abyssi]|uniref:Uncharacterized protein n=1 Tax=Marinithermofilum abyssi TaxID=1571185 RepID=A0A8J2VKL0_9BACL|nr:hypothetical protein GCM10011571_35450 [Marinithermofilum abyssi]
MTSSITNDQVYFIKAVRISMGICKRLTEYLLYSNTLVLEGYTCKLKWDYSLITSILRTRTKKQHFLRIISIGDVNNVALD